MRLYEVSKPFMYEEPVPGLPRGPIYAAKDVMHVCARSASRARTVALRTWRRWRRDRPHLTRGAMPGLSWPAAEWLDDADSGDNPFAEMRARPVSDDEITEMREWLTVIEE